MAALGAALFGFGFLKGCEGEREKWELLSAKAEAEAANETNRRIQAQAKLVEQSRERETKLIADRNSANAAVRLLRQSIANLPANSPAPEGSKAGNAVGDVLAGCGERLVHYASEADRAHSAGLLCQSIYDSLSNREKVKTFLRESKFASNAGLALRR